MKTWRIKDHEFKSRVARIQKIMREKSIDLLLAFSTESEPAYVRYLSDYWPSFETAGVLIPQKGDPILLIGPESLTYASGRSRISRILQLRDFRESSQPAYPGSKLPQWREVLGEFCFKNLGVAGWHMFPQAIYAEMKEACPKIQWENADEILREVMMCKSPAELDCLREAARISELGFKAVLRTIKPGMTEVQIAGIATHEMLKHGAEATGYPVWCCSGPNSNQAISRPTHRKVKTGEIIHLSVGAKVEGYSASIGRPMILGKCPAKTRHFLEVGCEAQQMTIDFMRGGAVAGEVARKVHDWIRSQGYGHTILYGPAHGCGQMECEYPFLESSSTFTLEKGMTFMVDLFLAEKNQGFRWEDGVIIRDGAPEELSTYKRQINILEVKS
jgi:Xaa-Pro aminopeptidase